MNHDLMFSSNDNEHYTPHDLLYRVLRFYDDLIDLDPCCNDRENPHTPSRQQFTIEDDGLSQPWHGKVFVNPPYGNALKDWANKVAIEYESGNAQQILFLVPSRTDTQWYKRLSEYPRCNIHGRLKFLNAKNKGNAAPFPSVLFYLGKRKSRFREYFELIGEVIIPSRDRTEYKREYMKGYMQQRRGQH
ncbi:hypothetical protein LEP3755_43130 [Leptolyngbya sp. NIES-3755]|nr:hypothetical protein LEP3755_43130 [Leptolyngbya sp. NIES-3755]